MSKFGTVSGVDDDGNSQPLKVTPSGSVDITQSDLFNTFVEILKELKKINLHLSLMTDEEVKNTDIE